MATEERVNQAVVDLAAAVVKALDLVESFRRMEKSQEKMTGHIEVINKEYGEVRDIQKISGKELSVLLNDMGILRTNVEWLTKFFWIVAGTSVSGAIAAVLNLILR